MARKSEPEIKMPWKSARGHRMINHKKTKKHQKVGKWQRMKRWLKDLWLTVKQNKGLAILMGVMTIFNAMLAIASLLDRGVSSHGYEAIWSIILLLVLTVVVGLVFYRAKRRNWPIERIFLVVGLLAGFLYVFIVPMNAQQDEGGHFLRTWEIAEGNLLSKGGEGTQAPQNVWEAISREESDAEHEYIRVYNKTGIMATNMPTFRIITMDTRLLAICHKLWRYG